MNYCPTNANRLRRKGVAACVAFLTLLVPAFASVHAAGNPASPAADSVRRQPAAAKTTVKGYVFDESNQPLFGATVTEEGTTNAVAVDKNGSYQIQVMPREGLKLTYRFLGMEPQTVEVGRRSTIDVVLKSDAVKISDVVVTGYGNILREAYTGSASILSSNDISRRAAGSFEGLLGGLVPGLLSSGSGQPGDAAELRLRGFGSIGSGGQPLYVIDGVVFDQDNTSGHSGAVSSPMATLNPADIASITILKDAASASLYGSQGANGVIVITTKQGVPSDRVRYTLSVQAGFSRISPAVRPDLVDSEQYKELWTEGQFHRLVQQAGGQFVENLNGLYNNKLGFTVDGKNYYQWYKQAQQDFNNYYAVPRPDGSYYNYDFWGADAGKLPSVDWYDKILRNASFQQYDLSLSGGSSTLKYYMSVGYLNQQGIIINSDLQRYSARVSVSADDRKKRINWGASANISRTEQSGPLTSGSNYNMPHYAALLLPSVVPAYLEDGSYNFRFPNNLLNGNHNPIASARDNIRKRPQFNLFVSAWVRLNITDWLDFRSDISQYYITGRRSDYFDRDFGTGYLVGGELTDYDRQTLTDFANVKADVERLLDTYHFRDAQKEAMNLARIGNKYLADTEPWKLAKTDMARVATIMNIALQITANLAIAFEPFLPFSMEKLNKMLNVEPLGWNRLGSTDLLEAGHQLGKSELLFEKIEDSVIEAQVQKLLDTKKANEEANYKAKPIRENIEFDDFMKLDIRVGTVLECTKVPKADKLLQFRIDDGLEKRTIVSGIAQHYKPEDLVGKQVCFIANLAPRKLKGIVSEGMILSAENFDGKLAVITPEKEVKPGSEVK